MTLMSIASRPNEVSFLNPDGGTRPCYVHDFFFFFTDTHDVTPQLIVRTLATRLVWPEIYLENHFICLVSGFYSLKSFWTWNSGQWKDAPNERVFLCLSSCRLSTSSPGRRRDSSPIIRCFLPSSSNKLVRLSGVWTGLETKGLPRLAAPSFWASHRPEFSSTSGLDAQQINGKHTNCHTHTARALVPGLASCWWNLEECGLCPLWLSPAPVPSTFTLRVARSLHSSFPLPV